MNKYIHYWLLFITLWLGNTIYLHAQERVTLDLHETIGLANDSSLEAFRTQNMYLSGYWEYRTYKANRLPSLTLNMTPARYNRDFTQRYDSENNLDVYRSQRSFYAYGNLAIRQNFDLTGGTFFLDTELAYLRNFGDNKTTQYTSVPIRIGYSQSLLGYNAFKWERKIEPLKFEKIKKEFIYNTEQVAESAISYFFKLATAQVEYNLAKDEVASSDTLYRMGLQRHQIAAISQSNLLTLKLDHVNARNRLQNASISLKRAMFSLASFLNLDRNTEIELVLPQRPQDMMIPVDAALTYAKENNPTLLGLKQSIWEAERNVDKTKKESRFNASLSASIGYNQSSETFSNVYQHPMRQEMVALSVSIPLIDWGVRKGKYNMARNNLNVTRISSRQSEISLEEDVIMTVNDFNIQQDLIISAEEAMSLALLAYNETKQRFMIGKEDINSLTLSLNRQQEAQHNYITALENYWLNYYKIRKLTLHDFATGMSLSEKFDYSTNGRY
ncbi:TolC family protein [Bacteroides sp. 214]|uniref:TolC family protein n=1 Tax=Bacteroides sp. 214 TaxID=2302935 RepID=UPI0013D191A7|nr:TolC family protein [Bacteroides sp. 214]NDW11620.1 TolC family protein [Bacteroides sp. 214]